HSRDNCRGRFSDFVGLCAALHARTPRMGPSPPGTCRAGRASDRSLHQMSTASVNVERRMTPMGGLEVRKASNGMLKFRGLASRTETPYKVGDFPETIAKGAFAATLAAKADVALLVGHTGLPLARTSSGTLRLSESSDGLVVEAELDPDDPDVAAL